MEDYCELCDLPLSTCVHGRPPAPPPEPAPRASAVRTRRTTTGERATTSRTPGTPTPARTPARAPSRVTAQGAFRPHVLRLLADHGGSLDHDGVLAELAERMDDVLLERDRQVAPGGEVRWQTTARKERKAMIDEGLVVPAQPGIWELTDLGRAQVGQDPTG